jgi:hypothetical protein
MRPSNRKNLADKVNRAASAALAAQGYVSAIDVLTGIGWLEQETLTRWRKGQLDYLERQVHANLSRISEAMKLFRSWANARGLRASETRYVRKVPGRPDLRFSKSGHPTIERLYRTHFVSTKFADEKRKERTERKARRADCPAREPEPMSLAEYGVELEIARLTDLYEGQCETDLYDGRWEMELYDGQWDLEAPPRRRPNA